MDLVDVLGRLGVTVPSQTPLTENTGFGVVSPGTGELIGRYTASSPAEIEQAIAESVVCFRTLRHIPAPIRGECVRRLGQLLREYKQDLAYLVTLESGKIVQEALGEVQEMIDVCDFAVGLSRQLHGLTIACERPNHRMMEQWHPLGPVVVISAFNFPVAVWAWNSALAFVCGNPVLWKPSAQSPLTALACHQLFSRAAAEQGVMPDGMSHVLLGEATVGESLVRDPRIALVSATGSTRMGREVASVVGSRLGRSLLELGGNNAMIVTPSADLSLALRAIVFSAVGTAGQRCTSLRRLIVHRSKVQEVIEGLKKAYGSLQIGDPSLPDTHLGPVVSQASFEAMQADIQKAISEGGTLHYGGERITEGVPGGAYVRPAIVEMPRQTASMHEETFAPLLYVVPYQELDEAIEMQNAVPQGLSSAIFTDKMRDAERFLSASGSDCGIANVNIGTSGAEIGGAFGGEKDTGGGRESGSDAWKNYMRRSTNTINYGEDLPLAQGIEFDV